MTCAKRTLVHLEAERRRDYTLACARARDIHAGSLIDRARCAASLFLGLCVCLACLDAFHLALSCPSRCVCKLDLMSGR